MSKDLETAPGAAPHIARWQKAQRLLVNGRPDQALGIYQELLKQFPDTSRLWYELGFAAGKQLEFALADEACERAAGLAAASRNVSLLILLGQQYHWLRRTDRARQCFEQAVAVCPASIHAQLSLADWYERERRLDDAWRCVQACLDREPKNAQVQCVQALLLHRSGKNAEAETLLRQIIQQGSSDPNVNYSSRHQLAVVLDQMGQYQEAFRWLGEAKDLMRKTANVARLEQDYDRVTSRRAQLLAKLTPESIPRWRRESAALAPYRLALLGGHPRTGTTLLEQVLGAHPGIAAFDEPMAFPDEVTEKLSPVTGAAALTVKSLDVLPPQQIAHFRVRYFKSLLRGDPGEFAGKMLLDKNPSPTAWLHIWLRIFPDLKVIIALRDPRDVIVSCYFQNLRLNTVNANFLSLDRTVTHYADLMDVWLRLRELGGFEWLETRYENMVADIEKEGRRVTEFLGLAWDAQQPVFYEKSRGKFVFSPTYNEATKPVYRGAVGRWKNYAEALAPLQPRLQRYCKIFNYD